MPVLTCGMPMIRVGIFIGIIYLIHSLVCLTYTIVQLNANRQDRNSARTKGLPFIEDQETISSFATLLSLSLICAVTSALLILGCIRRNYVLFVPWLFSAGVTILLTGIYLFVSCLKFIVASADTDSTLDDDKHPMKIAILSLALVLQIVIFRTIQSLQNELILHHKIGLLTAETNIYILQHEDRPVPKV